MMALLFSALLLASSLGHFVEAKAQVVFNASNMNSFQTSSVVESGNDSPWVKHLGVSASLDACESLCQAYGGVGAPCRSFTCYGDLHPNVSLRGTCFGHVDRVWLPLAVPFVDAGILARACESGLDCSLNGVCDSSGGCSCRAGWTGDRCESLAFEPVDGSVLCFDPSEGGRNMSSWGGGALEINGTWHLYASEMANHCGIGSYLLNSGVVHAVADEAAGPYKREASGEFVIPPFAHEPVVARAPTGEIVLVAMAGEVNASFPSCVCVDGSTTPDCKRCDIPGGFCHPQLMTLMWSFSPLGPWTSRPLFPDETQGENPSVWIANNGSAYGMCRGGGMCAFASDWKNLSTWTHEVVGSTPLPGNPDVEDPFIFQDGDDHFHALIHNLDGPHDGSDPVHPVGVHAFSEDGLVWHYGGLAYTNVVETTSGGSLVLNRRERPHFVFAENDPSRRPVALVTSAEAPGYGDRSFTLIQRLVATPEASKLV